MDGQDRENGFPLSKGRIGWDNGKEILAVKVVRPWNGIPRESAATPSQEVSKDRLGRAWINPG